MAQKFRYLDSEGKVREAEAFITADYSSTGGTAHTPIMTNTQGIISPGLLPSGILRASVKTEFITLSQSNIDTKKIILAEIPLFPLNAVLIPEGGIFQRSGLDFNIVNENELSWEVGGLSAIFSVGDNVTITYYYFDTTNNINFSPVNEEITLTSADIQNGYVTLQYKPVFPLSLILIPDGAIPQTVGNGFSIDAANKRIVFGDILPLLEVDSPLRVLYYYS
jgi:hypothetical protein